MEGAVSSARLRSPFPWFGGKARAAELVWARFGAVTSYVEPFFGSGAVLFGRPVGPVTETVNDLDCCLVNFWRGTRLRPEEVAEAACGPLFENDLHARHATLVARREELRGRLEADPDYCEPLLAGWWAWGMCRSIGASWSRGEGPWKTVPGRDGVPELRKVGGGGKGIQRSMPKVSAGGSGVGRRDLAGPDGAGNVEALRTYLRALAERLRGVRICCGDWTRVLGKVVLYPPRKGATTAVLLDPPYGGGRDRLYADDDPTLSARVREWAIAHGDDPRLRIALCGYAGEHVLPANWTEVVGRAGGCGLGWSAMGKTRKNAGRERIWFSPHCLTLP